MEEVVVDSIMETWQATIKERGKDTLLTPSYTFASGSGFEYIQDEREREYEVRKFLIKFWGLNRKDVQWYTLEKKKERNEVTNFLYYMYNKWCIGEAKKLFGDNLGEHIFSKWAEKREYSIDQNLSWYSELDDVCRNKIVARANEIYNK